MPPTKRGHASRPFGHHGAVAKRRNNAKIDQDGDLSMDGGPGLSGRISKSRGRGGGARATSTPTRSTGSHRGLFSNGNARQQILKHLNVDRISDPQKRSGRPRNAPLKDIKITGWKQSKAADNMDEGASNLIGFLERKANHYLEKNASSDGNSTKGPVKIRKTAPSIICASRVEGDAMIVSMPAQLVHTITGLNGWVFAGSNLKIELAANDDATMSPAEEDLVAPEGGQNIREIFQNFLGRRYNAELKLLDLSGLGQDPELLTAGLFKSATTESKFFPALMKISDSFFKTAQEKRETVHSVTLANNSLESIKAVSSLAQTFPDLKNLDLSNNKLATLGALEGWKHKFRYLDLLQLTGNPLEQVPDFASEITRWYPRLRILNSVQVRTDAEASQPLKKRKAAPPVGPPCFQDQNGIAEKFARDFFVGFDSNRSVLVDMYYDSTSRFSLNLNTHAQTDPSQGKTTIPHEWDAYIKLSRNLTRITNPGPRQDRLAQGGDKIKAAFENFPHTRHPPIDAGADKWNVECVPLPGGLVITIHGEYEELEAFTGLAKKKRSFDRTFTLGPGGATGVKVVSDLLTIRAYGGTQAFKVEPVGSSEQGEKERTIAELAGATKLKPEFAGMALEENGWNLEAAMAAFQTAFAEGRLPQEAFL